ncbi:MAG: GNAT family N-acetyltransferase [Streptococcaceae bacterium]|jgi:ribosomal protein S18 acetylase RimI-like enzyme|nr:GNAT family N-acetyltransferase [Streptococcaceae bacterium]
MANYTIRPYQTIDYPVFLKMFYDNYINDYEMDLTMEQMDELAQIITQSVEHNIMYLDLLFIDEVAVGFIKYQVDTPVSDWCEKEGFGFIRELHVNQKFRGKGYGKSLAKHAENQLRSLNVPGIYLTTDTAMKFWQELGFKDTGEVCEKNDGFIFIKE